MKKSITKTIPVLLGLGLFISPIVGAIDFGYGFFSSLRQSDNLNQSDNGNSGTAYDLGMRFGIGNNASNVINYEIDGVLATADYTSDDLDREYYRSLDGRFQYQAVDSNFGFIALEQLTQVPANRFATQETNNLRDINVYAARPTYYIRLSGEDKINLYATYIDFSAGENTLDATNNSKNETMFSMDYAHRLNPITTITLVAEKSETDFDEAFNELTRTADDFSQNDIFMRWETRGKTTSLRANLGQSEVTTDSGEKFDADLLDINLSRVINRTQSINLGFRKGFDSLLGFNLDANQININSQSVNFNTALETKQHSLTYEYRDISFSSSLRIFSAELSSVQVQNNETRKGAEFNISYSLSHLLKNPLESNIQFQYSRTDSEFSTQDVVSLNNLVENFEIRFNYSINRKLDLYARVEKRVSESQNVGEAMVDSSANNFVLGVTYTPVKRRKAL
ncbi:hypothetical protein [Aliikangiella maris]|uniref:Uncharacterized protein n=2 Tax=Aliikangiella maris TaxID=3162458 RepID=A0ABV2BXX5_9GAMM